MKANTQQQEAIECVNGPLLIIAGAGSGKTATLTQRIAYMISEKNITPSSILALTFTNKAASEMKERTGKVIGADYHPHMMRNCHLPYIGTFHSFWIFILKEVLSNAASFSQGGERNEIEGIIWLRKDFLIYDEADKLSVMKSIVKDELGLIEKEYPPRQIAYFISDAKNKSLDSKSYQSQVDSNLKEVVAKAFERYEKRLVENNAIDFDDILWKLLQLFQIPGVLNIYQEKYQYIMVDEYQDTNIVQYKIVELLARKNRNLAVVGDDWQCLTGNTKIQTSEQVKNISEVKIWDTILSFDGTNTQKYYPIENIYKKEKKWDIYTIHTLSWKKIQATGEHIFFANPEWVSQKWNNYGVYLMYKKWFGYRIGYTRFKWLSRQQTNILWLRKRLNWERGDFAWLLKVTSSQKEAKYYEQFYSYKYSISQSVFYTKWKLTELDQDDINNLYKNINTTENVKKLFQDLKLSQDFPHIHASATNRFDSLRVNINFLMMWGNIKNRRFWMYRITLHTSHPKIITVLESEFPDHCRKAKLWIRIDKELSDCWKMTQLVDEIYEVLKKEWYDPCIIRKMSFLWSSYYFTPAMNLRKWFIIPVWDPKRNKYETDEIAEIDCRNTTEIVYDLDIRRTHNFIANNIVTHNSIYSWRWADMRNIIEFKKDYADAKIIKLEQNYRSTKCIIEAANAVIKNNKEALKKELWTNNIEWEKIQYIVTYDDKWEANWLAENITDYVASSPLAGENWERCYSDNLILYRTNAQSRSIEEWLIKKNIPYKIFWGLKFYDRKEVKDMLCYLRVILNSNDPVWFKRIVNTPARKIGAKSLQILDWYRDNFGVNYFQIIENIEEVEDLRPQARESLHVFWNMFQWFFSASNELSPSLLLQKIIDDTRYEEYLREQFSEDEYTAKKENLQELRNVASEYEGLAPREALSLFLEEVALISDVQKTEDWEIPDTNFVTLMTIHSAKWLEEKRVFVTGLEEWMFPHSRTLMNQAELEEERRLMYVAMTRACEELFITRAKERLFFGDYVKNPESRFLKEIPENCIETQEIGSSFSFSSISSSSQDTSEPMMRAVRKPIQENNVADFRAWEQVEHHKFGIWVIDSLIWELAEIRFRWGIKKMNIRIAPVKKVV